MTQNERERYWMSLEEELLLGGAAFSAWCTFITKDVYAAFIAEADLSTVVMSLACIETYFKTENPDLHGKSLCSIIDYDNSLSDDEKLALHKLRKYRNKWVHMYSLDDDEILEDETPFVFEAEKMACLAVKMLLTVLFMNQFV